MMMESWHAVAMKPTAIITASRSSPDELGRRPFRYKLYGLKVSSELALPELRPDDEGGDAGVVIRAGQVPASEEEGLSFGPGGAVLRIQDVATYLIRDGREVVVDAIPGASLRNVRLYLLGSAMGVLLHQKALLPLHANAVEIDGRAVAFMGRAGAGKSTLASVLHDLGNRVIADDVCVLEFNERSGRPCVHPGLPRIRLWKDALERSGRDPANYELSFSGDESYEKFDVPVSLERSSGDALDIAALYLLSDGGSFKITSLTGVDAVEAVFSNTYRGFAVSGLGQSKLHFEAALKLVRSTPTFRLERRRNPNDMTADVTEILAHVRAASRSYPLATSQLR